MEIIEDLLQDTGREEFIPVVSEYFERNTGNADYDVELCEDGNLICRSGDRAKLEFFTVNGEVTDDNVEYTIFEGSVIPNKLKDGIEKAESPYDYEYFNGVSKLAKKNYFTMVGYFLQDSYSTCDFHNFDKEKPKDEE